MSDFLANGGGGQTFQNFGVALDISRTFDQVWYKNLDTYIDKSLTKLQGIKENDFNIPVIVPRYQTTSDLLHAQC